MNLLTHLGLGDHLITYGLVRELEQRYGSINLFCKPHNKQSLSSIYLGTNVSLIVVENEQQAFEYMAKDIYNSMKIGYKSQSETELNFGESFYKEANVNFEVKNKYKIGRSNYQITSLIYDKFIHDTAVFKIEDKGFRPAFETTEDITDYCDMIENAKEVHVIESSFKQLIEFLNPKGKLFLHKFENKSFRVVGSKHDWTISQH
jgi:hypothetical protein